MNKKQILSAAVLLLLSFTALAVPQTLLVDVKSQAANPDGQSRATAYPTIQAAIDAANVDDTVLVYPGEYKTGSKTGLDYDSSKGSSDAARVVVWKRLTLKSVEGRDGTLIVGAKAFSSNKLTESGTVRCIEVTPDAAKSVISGFTLASGGSCVSGGAGIKCPDDKRVYVCDCSITNCLSRQRGGASYWGYFTGCLYADNSSENAGGCAMRGYFRNCVFYRNKKEGFHYPGEFYNCAFIRNSGQVLSTHNTNCYVYNCVFLKNDTDKLGGAVYHLVNCVSDRTEASFATYGTSYENCQFEATEFQFLAPAFDDWRALSGSKVATAGNAAHFTHLSYESIPNLDYAGNLITATTGSCCAGPVQTVATSKSGSIWFDGDYEFEGVARPHKDYAFSENYPTQYFVRAVCASGEETFRYGVSAGCGATRYAGMNGWICVMPPSDAATSMNLNPVKATAVLHADPTGKDGAYRTLQEAVDAASDSSSAYTIIHAAAGDYKDGGKTYYGISNRVVIANKNVKIVGAGEGKSFIFGAPDPAPADGNADGLGPNAMRCVACDGNNLYQVVQGFTLTGGRTDSATDAEGNAKKCAAVFGYVKESSLNPTHVLDCTISNCVAQNVAAFQYGLYTRVKVIKNRSVAGSIIDRAYLYSSLVADNVTCTGNNNTYAHLNYLTYPYFCTVVGSTSMLVRRYQGLNYNTIFSDSITLNGSKAATTEFYGNLLWNTAYDPAAQNITYTVGDPRFVRRADGDYRIFSDSKAIAAGDTEYVLNDLWKSVDTDLEGNRLVFAADGKPTCGAYQMPQKAVRVTIAATPGGGVTVEGGKIGDNEFAPGHVVTVTAVETNRLFRGFVVNGSTLPASETSVCYEVTGDETAGFAITATYSDGWYVNANTDPAKGVVGDDANDGCTPQTPKRTLKAILSAPGLLSGETVHAAAGTYDELTMLHANPVDGSNVPTIASRAVVPYGVTLLADEGPEVTFIVGKAADDPEAEHGLGEGAVRCVMLETQAKVSGFTLKGGRTGAETTGDDYEGSAVLGRSVESSLVENCLVTENDSCSGSLVYCHVINCRIFGNATKWRRSVGYNFRLTGCVIDNNSGEYPIQYYFSIDNCTIGPNNHVVNMPRDGAHVNNSLVLLSKRDYVGGGTIATNSAFVAGCGVDPANLTDCVVTNLDALRVAADYTPVIGANAGIDRGNAEILNDKVSADGTDLYGNLRVANAAMDMGAVEAPWLGRYSKDLKTANLAVTNASPMVKEAADRTVEIPAGGRVDLVWTCPDVSGGVWCEMPVEVSGAGTLRVSLNGTSLADVVEADGLKTVRFLGAAGENRISLVFDAEGSGKAVLHRFRADVGTAILIR